MWTNKMQISLIGFMLAWLCLLPSLPADAFERPFPPTAKRGALSPAEFPFVIINGKQRTLSPGAKIRNVDNMIQVQGSLPRARLIVNYTENAQGAIDQVWLLTADEARRAPTPPPPAFVLPPPRPIQSPPTVGPPEPTPLQ
jgi:hypothetical protein